MLQPVQPEANVCLETVKAKDVECTQKPEICRQNMKWTGLEKIIALVKKVIYFLGIFATF